MKLKFHDIVSAKYHNKPISIRCRVSGKSISPYCIPSKIRVKTEEGTWVIEIKPGDESILRFIDIKTSQIGIVLTQLYGYKKFSYKVIEVQNVERIFILPMTGKERNKIGSNYTAYYIGYGVDINTLYDMKGYTTVDPTNQATTHVFTEGVKVFSDIENFSLTKEIHNRLNEFTLQKENLEEAYDRLDAIYEAYSHNITKIYNRTDLHLTIDLAFRSVISFYISNEFVHKGWTDVMVIGDTRCGKGYVAEKLMKYFAVGEVVSGDNVSFSGLVGGLQQFNKHWVITWGKIPMNDCGFVLIDEAGELKEHEWSRLSRIRSEGVAEITKIQSQVTNARTRLLFLVNPPNKMISNYSYGIQSLSDVVKAPEDIARFDYCLVVAHNEVTMNEINKPRKQINGMFTPELEQDLILWTWSRKPNEVQFSEEAIKLIYDRAIKLSQTYTFTIPLIQGENVRIKLAKISIAFASRFYSTRNEGKTLFVKSFHVECAFHFINMIYKKNVSGYYALSNLQEHLNIDYETDFRVIEGFFKAFTNKKELWRCLLINNNITAVDISEHLNLDQDTSRDVISRLLQAKCIVKTPRVSKTYIKTPAFTEWLKKVLLAKE